MYEYKTRGKEIQNDTSNIIFDTHIRNTNKRVKHKEKQVTTIVRWITKRNKVEMVRKKMTRKSSMIKVKKMKGQSNKKEKAVKKRREQIEGTHENEIVKDPKDRTMTEKRMAEEKIMTKDKIDKMEVDVSDGEVVLKSKSNQDRSRRKVIYSSDKDDEEDDIKVKLVVNVEESEDEEQSKQGIEEGQKGIKRRATLMTPSQKEISKEVISSVDLEATNPTNNKNNTKIRTLEQKTTDAN